MIRDLPFEVPTEPFLAKAAADRAAAAAAARNNQGFITLSRILITWVDQLSPKVL